MAFDIVLENIGGELERWRVARQNQIAKKLLEIVEAWAESPDLFEHGDLLRIEAVKPTRKLGPRVKAYRSAVERIKLRDTSVIEFFDDPKWEQDTAGEAWKLDVLLEYMGGPVTFGFLVERSKPHRVTRRAAERHILWQYTARKACVSIDGKRWPDIPEV